MNLNDHLMNDAIVHDQHVHVLLSLLFDFDFDYCWNGGRKEREVVRNRRGHQ